MTTLPADATHPQTPKPPHQHDRSSVDPAVRVCELGECRLFNSLLVPRQATFARLTSSRRARSCALPFRQMM